MHGYKEQGQYSIFEQQDFICDTQRSPWHMMRFIQRGNRWLDSNLSKFDVMHCNGAFHSSVVPAAHAERARVACGIIYFQSQNAVGGQRRPERSAQTSTKKAQID